MMMISQSQSRSSSSFNAMIPKQTKYLNIGATTNPNKHKSALLTFCRVPESSNKHRRSGGSRNLSPSAAAEDDDNNNNNNNSDEDDGTIDFMNLIKKNALFAAKTSSICLSLSFLLVFLIEPAKIANARAENVTTNVSFSLLSPDLEQRRLKEEAASVQRIQKLQQEIIKEENMIRAGEMKKVVKVNDEILRLREQEMKKVDLLNAEAESFKEQQERIEANSRDAVARGEALCVTPQGIDVVGITELVALIGASASGIRARRQKVVVDELNEKLREINVALSSRNRTSSVTRSMGGSSSTPVDSPMSTSMSELNNINKKEDDQTMKSNDADELGKIDDAATKMSSSKSKKTNIAGGSMDSIDDTEYDETRVNLKKGRKLLRERNYPRAIASFEKALTLARMNGDQVKVRRAVRGLGATRKAMGEFAEAIRRMEEVLEISKAIKDFTGDMDAIGSIADMYTELGDLEKAGAYYDMYLNKINDESVDYED